MTSEAPHRDYVLHWTGCSQEDDQLLREGRSWPCAPGRLGWIDSPRTGWLDPDDAAAAHDRHGSDDLYLVDLRPPASSCREDKGRASGDAKGDRGGQEKERQDRCQQDRRLPAMRLSAGVPLASVGGAVTPGVKQIPHSDA